MDAHYCGGDRMAEQRVERRLAAILAGDVAGYSRLMGADEEGTLARLNAHRREFLEPTIAAHRGRIVKRTGDGILIEFASAVDAARCAVEQQRGMVQRNAAVPADQRIEFRIGIHVGDIMIEEGDILGDGVNIAARLESIAQPGGICISDDTYRQIRGKLDVNFQDSGEQELKNIARPVRVYQLRQTRRHLPVKHLLVALRCPTSPRSQCWHSRT
jgi:adenylate cyclase